MTRDVALAPENLGEMSTCKTDIGYLIRGDEADEVRAAQKRLLSRYQTPILRYVRQRLPQPGAADTIFQQFALRLLQGRFRSYDPERGRFRVYLKTALSNLISDYYRDYPPHKPLPPDLRDPNADGQCGQLDETDIRDFLGSDLMLRALAALAATRGSKESSLSGIALRMKYENPGIRSAKIAEILTTRTGRVVTTDRVRKEVHNDRLQLLTFVFREVAATLENPTLHHVEQELIDLGLHAVFKSTLRKRREDWM